MLDVSISKNVSAITNERQISQFLSLLVIKIKLKQRVKRFQDFRKEHITPHKT